jgi:hypothetical protein
MKKNKKKILLFLLIILIWQFGSWIYSLIFQPFSCPLGSIMIAGSPSEPFYLSGGGHVDIIPNQYCIPILFLPFSYLFSLI